MTRVLSAALAVFVAAPAFAQAPPAEKLPDGAKVVRLDVKPAAVKLTGPFAYSQLLVTAHLEGGTTADVTRIATYTAPGPHFNITPAGMVRPGTDGSSDIGVTLAGQSVKVPVTVSGMKTDTPVSFVTDVQPVLSKLGCNAGTCHGAQAGKNGFKLSLRGYDPIYDYRALTDDLEGRRFNRAAPERSLMLMKPAGAAPHQGGVMMQPGDPNYELVRRWIAQGVKFDPDAPRVKSVAVEPQNPTVQRIGDRQQFAIVATYTDGRTRDVTAEAFVESSNTEVATVDKTGLMTSVRRGEATMLARYEGAYAASTVVILGDRSGFAWEPRPVHNFIDELVDAKLKKVKVQPSPVCDDAEFVRRVYLDLTGLPPSPEAVKAFLDDKRDTKAKRDALIDELVGGEAFVEHWTNKWADLLQVNTKFLGNNGAAAFRKWIREAVAKNTPYDKFAYEVLTASGSNVDNPPAAYFKVLRTPDAVMENTTQLFLAIRFNCNKCHDHPFERWTQDNYYNLAAYFAQVRLTEDPKFKGQKLGGTAVEGAKPLVELVTDQKGGDVKHERTGEVAPPRFPYTVKLDISSADPRRVQAAKWVTSPQNPYFAKSYVNRLWSYLLGVGIIEPVDDIRAGNPPTNPELLDKLTAEFVKGGFDTRALIKTICKSRTYQLSLATNKWNKDDEINYSHALARRLPAEVLFDAIHAATGSQSRLPGLPPGARAAQLVDSNVNLPGGFLELFGKPVRESACECERSGGLNLGPVLAMVNGPIVADAIKDPNNRITKLVLGDKDDAKVVAGLYLSVLNRHPTKAEVEAGVKALRSAGPDHAQMVAEHKQKVAAFEEYKRSLDPKQAAYEDMLRTQKPTNWLPVEVEKAVTKGGAKGSAKLTVQPDGSVLATGKADETDTYTVTAKTDLKDPITAIRLEVLSDKSLPKNGPGRSESGNFVLNEFQIKYRAANKPDAKPANAPLTGAEATFSQNSYAVAGAIDNNPQTGWAVFPDVGKDHTALFRFQRPVPAVKDGVAFTVTMTQQFGTAHVLGKFRLSVTTDKTPRLASPLSKEDLELLDTPAEERTTAQKAKLREMYLAQDKEYQRLAAEAAKVPPADPRVLGAQDLVWALINSPAFLFNH
jgi:hypothetical protein